jgi:hypothetical protein
MHRTSSRRFAALALLAIGAGQLLAPVAQAGASLNGLGLNGVGLNGVVLNGVVLNGTSSSRGGEQGAEAQPGAAPQRADVGRLRLREIRLGGDK